ncbi:BZ3500_MvSof-1268-A1-R1_Chr1-3g01606 [Microbotryum saponariae]|uniref:BZ3500_MvSof-1268-A1-R1_Chr1-3g01606 protein n=1 Tax=Microbotryum saponariae TaxID=289078 RepID=A0A2X0L2N5_9BASI|nr:BZ3500_MvSof-1268-A1-R1_Chr1-3g01606 [Microbotryum saponariae]SCZ94125.1 BZ3501_MvSof-1269-A2-R1_Chr1-3g01207 [Microbotryum saponariae]
MRMRTIRNSWQFWSRFPPSPRRLAPPTQPRGFELSHELFQRLRQAIYTTESKKTAQTRYYLTSSSPHHSRLGRTRRFGPAYLRALSAERKTTNCRTRRAKHFSQAKSSRLQSTTSSVSGRSFLASRNPNGICKQTCCHARAPKVLATEACRSCLLRCVLLRPGIDLTLIGEIYLQKHDWGPRRYERCLAVVERPYGDALSSTHHQHPSEVAVGIE